MPFLGKRVVCFGNRGFLTLASQHWKTNSNFGIHVLERVLDRGHPRSSLQKMIDDVQLLTGVNILGSLVFILILVYHWIDGIPSYIK